MTPAYALEAGAGTVGKHSMPGGLRAWSRMERALPHSPANSLFCRERCEPCYVQGPGHRPLCQDCSHQCPGPKLKVLLHRRMANSLPWLLFHSPKSQKTNPRPSGRMTAIWAPRRTQPWRYVWGRLGLGGFSRDHLICGLCRYSQHSVTSAPFPKPAGDISWTPLLNTDKQEGCTAPLRAQGLPCRAHSCHQPVLTCKSGEPRAEKMDPTFCKSPRIQLRGSPLGAPD